MLAPLGYLLPIIGMLRICRRSLPALGEVEHLEPVAPVERRELRLVDVAVSVLVPFLAVYTAYGLLDADIFRYRNIAAADVALQQRQLDEGVGATARRLGIYSLHDRPPDRARGLVAALGHGSARTQAAARVAGLPSALFVELVLRRASWQASSS